MEIDVISKADVERIAFNTVCDYLEHEDWQIEKGSIVQNIKDLTEKIDSHAKSLHNMFEAINAVSRMAAHHKEWIDKLEENDVLQKMIVVHKELIDNLHTLYRDLSERIKVLEELCTT